MFLLWVEPGDEFVFEDPVEYVHEEQGFDTSENIAGKMVITQYYFYLCLLVVRSIAMSRYLPLVIRPLKFPSAT